MYVPQSAGERVETVDGTRGEFTGETGEFGEHFVIELDSGETQRFHKEDLYELHGGERL